jgi:uncharacterized protein (DUF305 family)
MIMMLKTSAMALAAAALSLSGPVLAQGNPQGMDHSTMDHSAMSGMMQPTSANPYPPAEMEMHHKMMSAVGSDATETWVRKMIEHHRGAIAMSQIVLRETRDPKVREMATKSSAGQQREIEELQAWLRAQGKRSQ